MGEIEVTGGKKSNAGRKRHDPPLKERTLMLTDEDCKLLRKWGRGNVSAGLRWLLAQVKDLVYKPPEGTT